MVWRRHKKRVRETNSRITVLTIVIFIFVAFIILKLFDLQIIKHGFYTALASSQHEINQKLIPERGEIFVRDAYSQDKLYPVATNEHLNLVFAIPKLIDNPTEVADKIAPLLKIEDETAKQELIDRLSKKNDTYEPLAHLVKDEVVAELKQLQLKGIDYVLETNRYYPEGETFSQVLGFVGYHDDERLGQYGIEGYFNQELQGSMGFLKAEKDAAGRWITVGDTLIQEAKNGDDLVLTLDHTVQFQACQKLKEAVTKHGADEGSVIIMDPKTGAIIAMCNYPDFNPNTYNDVSNLEVYKNAAIYSVYEPGSVFKAFTMAAGLDLGLVTPQTTYEDTGQVVIGKYTIKNSDGKAHGVNTMTQVLEQSLNTGAIFVVQKVGNEKFYDYLKQFGFGEKTGIALDTESPGDISALAKQKDIYSATASYGQGISVTPLQLVTAYAAIANGGKLMKPYIVDEIIKNDGTHIKTEPQEVRQVISSRTAQTLSAMLVSVVKNGHGKMAGVPGYFVAGKTGTAQVPRTDGPGYESNVTIGSFAGFAPVNDPRFVMLIKIDRPRDVQWAESSAAPLFGDLAQFLLNYYQVPPTEETGE